MEYIEREHKYTPKLLQEFREYPMPLLAEHVWGWFQELTRARQSGMGNNPLSYSDIKSWAFLRRKRVQQWELDLLFEFDYIFLSHHAKKDKKSRTKTVGKRNKRSKAV